MVAVKHLLVSPRCTTCNCQAKIICRQFIKSFALTQLHLVELRILTLHAKNAVPDTKALAESFRVIAMAEQGGKLSLDQQNLLMAVRMNLITFLEFLERWRALKDHS
jgi:hypothetical protein